MYHPDIDRLVKQNDWTPLHTMAKHFKESISHKSIAKVKTSDTQITPLHHYTRRFKDGLLHPEAHIVQDHKGNTPYHWRTWDLKIEEDLLEMLNDPRSKITPNENGKTANNTAYAKLMKLREGGDLDAWEPRTKQKY